MNNLKVKYCAKKLNNPFVLPSGIITEIPAHNRAVKSGFGAVTLKSVTFKPRRGNPLPHLWKYDCGMLNSVGLRNPGIERAEVEIKEFIKNYSGKSIVIVSLFSTKIAEFVTLVERTVPLKPDFIELNLSCPNTVDELGASLGMEKGGAGKVVAAVKKVSGKLPVLAKLSPNVTDIGDIAKTCEAAGVDGIVAINTLGPGMVINIKTQKPTLGNKEGGVSGPGVLPVAVRCVYDIYRVVKIPIIGMGGVTKWQDAVQMMLAGATLVGVGTATYSKGMGLLDDLKNGLKNYLIENKYKKVADIVGLAHKT